VVSFKFLQLYPHGKSHQHPFGQEAGWTSEPDCTIWIWENSLPYRDPNSDPLVVHPVATL
jgi:hypothetical protein